MLNFTSFEEFKEKLLQDPEVKAEYERLEPQFELIEQVIRKRIELGMSQKQLAEKAGTKQSAISRLESGNYNPTLRMMQKIAEATNSTLHIELR